ncbi:hypothetical protein PSOL_06770 [Candidatus Phytoplasma solani]
MDEISFPDAIRNDKQNHDIQNFLDSASVCHCFFVLLYDENFF